MNRKPSCVSIGLQTVVFKDQILQFRIVMIQVEPKMKKSSWLAVCPAQQHWRTQDPLQIVKNCFGYAKKEHFFGKVHMRKETEEQKGKMLARSWEKRENVESEIVGRLEL